MRSFLVSYKDIKEKTIKWLWYPYIAYGKITLLEGDPGEGKTSIALYLISLLSRGCESIDNFERKPIKTIFQSAEDNPEDSIKPKLIRQNGNCDNVYFVKTKNLLTIDCREIEESIKELKPKLVIFDPLQAFLGENNLINVTGLREMLGNLVKIAEKYKCAVLLIGHMNKSGLNKDLYRSLGSIDLVAIARSVLMIKKPSETSSVRILYQIKNNLAALGEPVGFKFLENGKLDYIGSVNPSDFEADVSKLDNACSFLEAILSDGEMYSKDIFELAKAENITIRTLNRAKKELKIKDSKRKDGWHWSLKD